MSSLPAVQDPSVLLAEKPLKLPLFQVFRDVSIVPGKLWGWNRTPVADGRGDCQVGCVQVAFLGHEMVRFAAACTPKRLKLLILLGLAQVL